MEVFNQVPSRYKYTPLALTKNVEGKFELSMAFRETALESIEQNYVLYRVKEGDTLQNISKRFYRNTELWFVIADYNPKLIFYPTDIVNIVGKVIKLPRKSVIEAYY